MDRQPDDPPVEKRSPRRELQGPRPTPLKVSKESYKIRKPPAPAPALAPRPLPPVRRQPVIIYTASPKVIHTSAGDFMALVQRLTGPSSSSELPPTAATEEAPAEAISPAARLATIEKASRREAGKSPVFGGGSVSGSGFQVGPFPGILSPLPSSLPPISPSFFSPSLEANPLGFLLRHDLSLSPISQDHGNFMEGGGLFLPSPAALLPNPLHSPIPSFDLFNLAHFLD